MPTRFSQYAFVSGLKYALQKTRSGRADSFLDPFPRPLTIRNRRFRGLQGRVLALFPRPLTTRNRRIALINSAVLTPPQRSMKHSKCLLRHVSRETCRNRLPAASPSPLAAVRTEIAASGIEPEAFPRRSRNHTLDHSAKPALPGLGGLVGCTKRASATFIECPRLAKPFKF